MGSTRLRRQLLCTIIAAGLSFPSENVQPAKYRADGAPRIAKTVRRDTNTGRLPITDRSSHRMLQRATELHKKRRALRPVFLVAQTLMDQKRWVYFMYRKRPMSKPP
jgi:hypothetical protein